MNTAYKIELKAEDYPPNARAVPLEPGDSVYIQDENKVKVGAPYKSYPAYVSEVLYAPKKWWKFWMRKKQVGYIVTWR